MVSVHTVSEDLTEAQFRRISTLVRDLCGISLHEGKKQLVKARLSKRLRTLDLDSFDEYLDYVQQDSAGKELTDMLDAISTNLTSFFRESDHFDYLSETVLPEMISASGGGNRRLRLWSAGCSSGEEPYCLSMVAHEAIPDINLWDAKVLATDLSTRVLSKAAAGEYPSDRLDKVPPQLRNRYFIRMGASKDSAYRVADCLRNMVKFARLNLMDRWPMQGPFDAIFCRNVMIYFDKPTQERLVNRFWDMLRGGGTLFIGHSESLTGARHKFRYVQPTVYEKPR